jgi:ubiquinone biosynthesis protein
MRRATSTLILADRLLRVAALTLTGAVRMAGIRVTSSRAERSERLSVELVRLLERLGGAFVKTGQLAGTRIDLVGPTAARALSRLHDDVRPMAARDAAAVVGRALPAAGEELVRQLARPPVASGSIASVYRVEVSGLAVALKVRRPEIGPALTADLAVMRAVARVGAAIPGLRRVPMREIIGQVGGCLADQLDFSAEAEKLQQLGQHLAGEPGIVVPGPLPELCGDGVLAMQFVDGLEHASAGLVPEDVRQAQVTRLVQAVYRLLFIAGFVHVDLHQGNTYFRQDGSVVVLDAGFTFQLGQTARIRFAQFFGGMVRGDGDACAEILLATVKGISPRADTGAFRRDVAELVVRNAGAAVRDFDLPGFCVELFNLQRRHGLYADPEFVFPMLSLLSLDGLVKEHHPLLDFQIEAAPFVMQSLLTQADSGALRIGWPE